MGSLCPIPLERMHDPLDRYMFLHVFRVRDACGTYCKASPKDGFHAPAGQTLRCRFVTLCEKTDTIIGVCAFLWRRQCGAYGTPTRVIESISDDLHQEDSYQRTARAGNTKIGRLLANDMSFYHISTLGVAPHLAREQCKRQNGQNCRVDIKDLRFWPSANLE